MQLTHRFRVPVPVEEAWEQFADIASVAECFPGAVVTEADQDSFTGSVKVKLGPIALQYLGSGTFVEKDDAAHRMVVDAKGKDKRGNGTAGAHVTLTMTGADGGADEGATAVEVVTDLSVTGKPAQFGRGVMQDVSDKLLGRFVDCLEHKYAEPAAAAEPDAEPDAEPEADQDAEPASTPTGAAAEPADSDLGTDPDSGPASAPPPPTGPPPRVSGRPPPRPADHDALDLGATVLPVLARTYGPWVVGGLLLLMLWRRLRRS